MEYPALPPINDQESTSLGQIELTDGKLSDQGGEESTTLGKPEKPPRKRKVSETKSDNPPSQTSSSSKTTKQTAEGVSPPSSKSPEEVEKLIEYYRDPYKWSDLGIDDDVSDSDDDDEPRNNKNGKENKKGKFLHHSEKMALIKLLAALPDEDPSKDPIESVRKWAPKGFVIRGKELLFVTHPDRYVGKDEKEMAQKAFQVIEPAVARDRTMNIEGESENDKVDSLEHYHEEAHIKATKCIIKLYDAYKKGEPIGKKNPNLTENVKSVYRVLDGINKEIIKKNKEIGNAEEFGVIEIDQITNCWNPHNKPIASKLLWKLCESLHYPLGWTFQPPREDFTYDMDRGESWAEVKESVGDTLEKFWQTELKDLKTTSDLARHILASTDDCNKHIADISAAAKRPASLNQVDIEDIMAHYCGLKSFEEASMKVQFDNLRRHLEQRLAAQDLPSSWLPDRAPPNSEPQFKQVGSKMVISATPRTIEISMRPGYTQKGEQIIAMAKVGMTSARFVIEVDGLRRIVESARAGGKRVLQGAQKVGIPCTVTSYEGIREIEEAMDSGVAWKITYVAVGEWKTNRLSVKGLPMIPHIIVGIHILNEEKHASRSILGKLVGGKAADNLIVQALGGDEDESLIETLMSRLPMGDVPRLLTEGSRKATSFITQPEQKQASANLRDVRQANSNVDPQTDDLLAMKSEMEELKTMMSKLLLRMT